MIEMLIMTLFILNFGYFIWTRIEKQRELDELDRQAGRTPFVYWTPERIAQKKRIEDLRKGMKPMPDYWKKPVTSPSVSNSSTPTCTPNSTPTSSPLPSPVLGRRTPVSTPSSSPVLGRNTPSPRLSSISEPSFTFKDICKWVLEEIIGK